MNVFYEKYDSVLNISYYKDTQLFKKKTIYKKIDKLDDNDIFLKNKNTFLLDENKFSFYSFDAYISNCDKFKLEQLNQIIEEKKNIIKIEYWWNDKFLFYVIDNIFVDWASQKYVLKQSWNIYFRLNFVYLTQEFYYMFNKLWWNQTLNNNFFIYPQSFYSLYFLKNSLQKLKLNIVYILDEEVKLIKINEWFYENIYRINSWNDKLKSIFVEDDLLSIYNQSFKNNNFNDISKKLIKDSIWFYSLMINKWLDDYIDKWENIILISKLSKNKFFIEIFSEKYKKIINGYVLPFNYSNLLDDFNKKWMHDNIDLMIYFNNMLKSTDFFAK